MYEIVGIEKREGVYEGNAYSNKVLHCVYNKKDCEGKAVTSIKIKTKDCPEISIGDLVTPLYDRYGNCVHLDVQ